MMPRASDSPPLPDIDISLLQDLNYMSEFSPPSASDTLHIKEEFESQEDSTFTAEMLPSFYELLSSELSSKSADAVINFDEETRSDVEVVPETRHPSENCVIAPVWIPPVAPVMRREVQQASSQAECQGQAPLGAPRRAQDRESSKRERSISPAWSSCASSPVSLSSPPFSPFSPPSRSRSPDSSKCAFPSLLRPQSQRAATNLRERLRTRTVNDAFATLRNTLPLSLENKASKLQTLKAAANYIGFLHQVYAASAYKLNYGWVPKGTKLGVKHALNQIGSKTPFDANSDALQYAFNLWMFESELSTKRRKMSQQSSSAPSSSSAYLSDGFSS